ncbi:hypothetical protein [Nostoc sp. FACHB-133]|uniref:hypothetical protein n=1 Tax=Nostoc sp. FACHB-133 TaxID=2692835 RepID=UPI001689C25D|nr:hypothetical protein [Nostoc sp. FACHB-133]MBD2522119.1 hypothetical protein [Nostoc sp. FACHB-133]
MLQQTIVSDTEELKGEIIENLNNNIKLENIDPNQLLVIIDFALEKMKELDELEFILFIDKRIKEIKEKRYGLKNIKED